MVSRFMINLCKVEIIFLVVFNHATICTAISLYLQNASIRVSEFFLKVCTSPRHVCLSKSQLWRGKWRTHLSGPILYIRRVPRCFATCIFSLILSTTIMQRCCTHKQCCSLHYPPTRQRSALFQLKLIF